MSGFTNEVVNAKNVDFSGSSSVSARLNTNGQMLIGSTVLNAGGTNINVGTLSSPNASLSIGYSSPNITIDVAPAIAGNFVSLVSPIINFKTTGVTVLFTTPSNLRLAPVFAQYICESATLANGNGNFSVGWTGAAYTDYINADSFNPTTANNSLLYQTGSTATNVFPANTAIRANVTLADSGTSITGRIVIFGVYIT